MNLTINFLIDPLYEGSNKSAAVWTITASTQRPIDRLDSQNNVAELFMQKGRFEEKLIAFIEDINRHRDRKKSSDHTQD